MTDTAKRVAGPILFTNVEQTFYTVPALTTAILRHIHIANTSASSVTLKLSIGADAAGTRLLPDLALPANSTYDWSGFMVMAAAETLRGQAGTTNVCTLTVSGVEVT